MLKTLLFLSYRMLITPRNAVLLALFYKKENFQWSEFIYKCHMLSTLTHSEPFVDVSEIILEPGI
jgi:hypothetical protein